MFGNEGTVKAIMNSPHLTAHVKQVRRVYNLAFSAARLRRIVPELNGLLNKMLEIIESRRGSGAVDLQELCVQLTLDIIGIVAFEANLGGLDESRDLCRLMAETSYITQDRIQNPFKVLKCKCFPSCAEATRDNAIIDALTAEWTKLTQDILSREDPTNGETPVWFGLKQLTDPDAAEPLEFKDLRAEVATVAVTGTETTGYQLSWTLALLASNPDVTRTLLRELEEHGLYGEGAKKVTYEDIGDLLYLTATIKESLRIASTVSVSLREAPHDMTILGYRTPKGTYLGMPGNRWLDAEKEWGDPAVFRPGRWLEERDVEQRYYLGFSYGPRDCAGQKLAMLELRVALIRLLGAFHFSLTVPFDELMMDSRNGLLIRAEHGMWFHITPRTDG